MPAGEAHYRPQNTVERAADAAFETILRELPGPPRLILVLIEGAPVPEGEEPDVDALSGTFLDGLNERQRAQELFSTLIRHCGLVSEAAGVNLAMMRVETPPGGQG